MMTITITDSPFGSLYKGGKVASGLPQMSFETVLSSAKSSADARSHRALGFQEAGLLGVHRHPTETPRGARPEGVSPQVDLGAKSVQPSRNASSGHPSDPHRSTIRPTLAKSAQNAAPLRNTTEPSMLISQTLGWPLNRLSVGDDASPEVCKANGNSILSRVAIKRRRNDTLVINEDHHAISVLIGAPTLEEHDMAILHQNLMTLSRQYGVTLKYLMINGISGDGINCLTDCGD
jgi:hypothetical protein